MNKDRSKKLRQILSFALIAILLVGCVQVDRTTGQPTGEGWVYKYIGLPAAKFLDAIANVTGGSYGFAIIVVTLITRVFMIPTQIKQTKDQAIMQIRQKYAQPEISQIQAEMDATDDPAEQQALSAELMATYKKYDINMMGGLAGCLPLLVQLPILSAVYTAIRTSPKIQESVFLGIHLGEKSLLIVVLVVLLALAQGWLMQQATPSPSPDAQGNDAASQTQKTMLLMNPILMGWISWTSAAGLGLYFLASSTSGILVQLYLNYVVRPQAEANVEAEAEKYANLPKRKPRQVVKAQPAKSDSSDRLVPTKNPQAPQGRRRNEGIQRRR